MAEQRARERLRTTANSNLRLHHESSLKGSGNLRQFLKELGCPVVQARRSKDVPKLDKKDAAAAYSLALARALKQAKVKYHPDKVRGDLPARVMAEEISKILNSWDTSLL